MITRPLLRVAVAAVAGAVAAVAGGSWGLTPQPRLSA